MGILTRHQAANFVPGQLYRALDLSRETGVSATTWYRDLPYEAYAARRANPQHRLAFAGKLIEQIIEAGPMEPGWVHRAEALHVVSVPMLEECQPTDLLELLAPAVLGLSERVQEYPDIRRYCALLIRTMSLAQSKMDKYTDAFSLMNIAHKHLVVTRRERSAIGIAEAWQQTYLQECGQLSRNVEAALIEQDRAITEHNLNGRFPNREIDRRDEIRFLRITARAAAESGKRAVDLINFVRNKEGLPKAADPDARRLGASTWYLTCNIMYLRALMLAGLVEMCANADPTRYFVAVPDVWAAIIEQDPAEFGHVQPALTVGNQMDLVRTGLQYSFLHGGLHPYYRRPAAKLRNGVTDGLANRGNAGLSVETCAADLATNNHDAGILDNLAHVESYRLFADRSGNGNNGFQAFLHHRRNRLVTTIDPREPNPTGLRTIGRPTLAFLAMSARMVQASHRYTRVLEGV